ncbi:hypothetical protein ACPCA8_15100 [Streptomyces capoamus]|uniref:hypothetical protein n=1 Tax=Streptomyces capoamus TaxID=68183 RepID=UPI003C2BB31B
MLRRISLVLAGLLAAGFAAAAPAAAHAAGHDDDGGGVSVCWQSGGAASAGDTHAVWGDAGCAHVG